MFYGDLPPWKNYDASLLHQYMYRSTISPCIIVPWYHHSIFLIVRWYKHFVHLHLKSKLTNYDRLPSVHLHLEEPAIRWRVSICLHREGCKGGPQSLISARFPSLSAGLSDETHQAVGSFVSRWRSQTFTGFKALVSCLKTAVQAFYGHWWEPCLVTTPYICYISRLLKPYDRFVHEFCFRRLILGAVSVRLKLTIYFWCMEKSNVNTVQNIFFCAPQNCFFTTWVNYESFHFYVNS